MIYGLHAKDLSGKLLDRMDTYMYNHLRVMMNYRWKLDEWYPVEKPLYQTLEQPTMESRIHKTQVTTMLTQTHATKTIHPIKRIEIPLQKLQTQRTMETKEPIHTITEEERNCDREPEYR